MVLGFIPTNIIKAFYDANLIQVIMISILIGIALLSNPKLNQRVSAAIEVLYDMVIALVMVVLRMAPIGVFVWSEITLPICCDMLMPMMTYF